MVPPLSKTALCQGVEWVQIFAWTSPTKRLLAGLYSLSSLRQRMAIEGGGEVPELEKTCELAPRSGKLDHWWRVWGGPRCPRFKERPLLWHECIYIYPSFYSPFAASCTSGVDVPRPARVAAAALATALWAFRDRFPVNRFSGLAPGLIHHQESSLRFVPHYFKYPANMFTNFYFSSTRMMNRILSFFEHE